MAWIIASVVLAINIGIGYWLGEQAAYRSLGYGSERPFASIMAFIRRRR